MSTISKRKNTKDEATSSGKRLLVNKNFKFRQPGVTPTFTLDDVKRAIPKHCFERPWYKSFGYLFYDITMLGLFFIATFFFQKIALNVSLYLCPLLNIDVAPLQSFLLSTKIADDSSSFVSMANASPLALAALSPFNIFTSLSMFIYSSILITLWLTYWILSGAVGTGLWVIGHECGHGGFSASQTISDTVGLIVHSFLLVPYFSWQSSHRTHHSHTGDMELDEVHLPWHINTLLPNASHGMLLNDNWDKKTNTVKVDEESRTVSLKDIHDCLVNFSLPYRLLSLFIICTSGWWLYLIMNVSGRRYDTKAAYGMPVNHFMPSSPVFRPSEYAKVMTSNVALSAMIYLLYTLSSKFSLSFMIFCYFIPYMVVNFWLVSITLLQHTHFALPHYSSASWTYLKGSLSTVDRDFGPFWNFTFHNINDTHVVHHLFSYLPHYHAMEATNAVKELLGPWYIKTTEEAKPFGFIKSIWNSLTDCSFIAEDEHPALPKLQNAIKRINKSKKGGLSDIDIEPENVPGPHKNGRNIEKEVYWFRTVSLDE